MTITPSAPQKKSTDFPKSSSRRFSLPYESSTNNPLVGDRSQTISVRSEAEMFELVGYMATPGRVSSFEAEVPKDGRDVLFEKLFPGQPYRPIELGSTPSGMPNKLSPSFRINFANLRNCPGGYSYPGGSNGVSVKSQSLTFGQTGASKQGGIVTQNSTVNISSSSWSKTPPSSWVEVNESKTPCLVGANYILKLKRGTSSSTWTVELTNNIVYNPL